MSNDNFTEFKIEDKNAETTKKKLSESTAKNLSIGTDTTTVETLRTSFLSGEKKGWVVKVPLPSEYQNIPLPREQYVVTWIDIYTGRSLDKQWSELLGTNVNPADLPKVGDTFPGGMAQMYAAVSSDTNKFVPEDFIRLSNIQSIKSSISTNSTSPGSCTITLQNPLVQKKMGDTLLWERFYYKTGRYTEGSWVWYLAKDNPKKLWYRGKLRKANSTDPKIIKLDDTFFTVEWFKGTPSDNISVYEGERFFAEDLGEPLLEPMQKFKVYAVTRFPYNVLQKYGYGSVLKPGETNDKVEYEPVTPGSNAGILTSGPPHIINKNGESLTKEDTLTADNKTMYAYARPIFTGYIADVVNQQQGTEWSINITGKDITCWLDYSRLNVNPSLNLWSTDSAAESYKTDIPIYTIKYAGMSAEDIIKSLFLGGSGGDVKISTWLYTSSDNDIKVKRGEQAAIIYSQKVVIHDSNPTNNRYKVSTIDGLTGWINVSDIAKTYDTYTGVGNFKLTEDTKLPVYGMGIDPNKLHKELLPDKLIVNPKLENVSDEPIYDSYRKYFRQSWPEFQSEYVTRREVINTVCKTTNTECYADADGKVWFHPIWAYHSVLSPIFVLQKEDVLSWSFTFSDREVITWVQAYGEADFNANALGNMYSQAYEAADVVARFGIRGMAIKNPNLRDIPACTAFARSMMRRLNTNVITGTVTIVLRPEMQLARNVFIPWLNAIGYISNIETHIQYGSRATTTLGLKYVRRPWEAWTPIDYGIGTDLESAVEVKQSSSSNIKSAVTNPNLGTNQQGKQQSSSTATTTNKPKSSIADSSPSPRPYRGKSKDIWAWFTKFRSTFNSNVISGKFGLSAQKKFMGIYVTDPSIDSNDNALNFVDPFKIHFIVRYNSNTNVPRTEKDNYIGYIEDIATTNNFDLLSQENFPNLILSPKRNQ